MQQIDWEPALETGIEFIDSEHRHIVALANRLFENSSSEAIEAVLNELSGCFARNFTREEDYLQHASLPPAAVAAHVTDHTRLLSEFAEILYRASIDGCGTGEAVWHFLANTVLRHQYDFDIVMRR